MTEPRPIAITMDTSRRITTVATGYEEVPVTFEYEDGYRHEWWMPTERAIAVVRDHAEHNTGTKPPDD